MSAPRPRLYRFVGVVHRSRLIRDRKKEDAIRTKQARGKKGVGGGDELVSSPFTLCVSVHISSSCEL